MAIPPSDARDPARYQIPTHLNVPDRIAIPLLGITFHVTVRQGLIFLVGWSTAFQLWGHLEGLSSAGSAGYVTRLFVVAFLVLATFVVATLQVGGRYLEVWTVLLLRYHRHPRVSLWQPVALENSIQSSYFDKKHQTQYHEEEGSAWF
ncbi:hypothetical protein KDW_31150 [Dictyobacter vulcani]|uniref:Uncharacterized protein n=1 Tax=Dictyobacter vulcani TaxID=2607529 RepID=A0A5J4KMI7_9CHLR|nr:hypothetical protein [Dictyobacter vulcani]GER88953.1 hypothetical protein KDW_31150 [Dictyobacter vulcani]